MALLTDRSMTYVYASQRRDELLNEPACLTELRPAFEAWFVPRYIW